MANSVFNFSKTNAFLILIYINNLAIVVFLAFQVSKSNQHVNHTSTQGNEAVISTKTVPNSILTETELSETDLRLLLNNGLYLKYKNDPRVRPLIDSAKSDGVLRFDEYEKIVSALEKIHEDDNHQSDIQESQKLVKEL